MQSYMFGPGVIQEPVGTMRKCTIMEKYFNLVSNTAGAAASRRNQYFLPFCLVLLVAVCRGGGGSDDETGTLALRLVYGLKQLVFEWNAVPGANVYRLFEIPDGVFGFTQVGTDLTAPNASLDISVHPHDWGNVLFRLEANGINGAAGNSLPLAGAV